MSIREKSKGMNVIQEALQNPGEVYEWVTWNSEKNEGSLVSVPTRMQIPENINEQFIVELYSK